MIELIEKENKKELKEKQLEKFKDFIDKRVKYQSDLVKFILIFEFEKQ